MPLISAGCTRMDAEPCSGGCGKVAGARTSDGVWTCWGCAEEAGLVGDCGPEPDWEPEPFEARQYAVYHNGERFYVRFLEDGRTVLMDSEDCQVFGPALRRLSHLLPKE